MGASLGAPVQVSPLIRFGRYTALLLGVWWGATRFQANKATEDAYRAVEAEKKIIRDAKNADEKGIQKSTCLLLVKSKKHLWTLLVKFCPTNDELEPDRPERWPHHWCPLHPPAGTNAGLDSVLKSSLEASTTSTHTHLTHLGLRVWVWGGCLQETG